MFKLLAVAFALAFTGVILAPAAAAPCSPAPIVAVVAPLQTQCPLCVNSPSIGDVSCGCVATVFYQLHEGSLCSGTPCTGGGCSSTIKYSLSGGAQCTGEKTLQCSTECGGNCSSTGRCKSLSVTCSDCGT